MSVQVAFLLGPDDTFESGPASRDERGAVWTSVHLDGRRYGSSNAIQGSPSELRRLAEALTLAADEAEAKTKKEGRA